MHLIHGKLDEIILQIFAQNQNSFLIEPCDKAEDALQQGLILCEGAETVSVNLRKEKLNKCTIYTYDYIC